MGFAISDSHEGREKTIIVETDMEFDGAFFVRNFAQGKTLRHRSMVEASREYSLFLNRKPWREVQEPGIAIEIWRTDFRTASGVAFH